MTGIKLQRFTGESARAKVLLFLSQIMAMQAGRKLRKLPDEICRLTYEQNLAECEEYASAHFEGVRAVLEEKDPGFFNR